jgi:hypothetical protein
MKKRPLPSYGLRPHNAMNLNESVTASRITQSDPNRFART